LHFFCWLSATLFLNPKTQILKNGVNTLRPNE
jgi:hypothetical protein